MNVLALTALKRVEIETHALRHDASEHHVAMALWTSGTMNVDVDVFGQGMRFWHDASLEEAERNTLWHRPVKCRGDRTTLGFEIRVRCSILISSRCE
jgi:hypothetical protein